MLRRADQSERRRLLRSYLRDQAARSLGITASLLDIQSPLTNFGLDSLMAAELRTQIERDTGVVVPVVELIEKPSVAGLADWLGAALSTADASKPNEALPADPPAANPDGAQTTSDRADARWIDLLIQVPEVSDDDVDALLHEVLSAAEGKND